MLTRLPSSRAAIVVALMGFHVPVSAISAAAGRTCADDRSSAAFAATGPHPVGETTLTFVDRSRPTPANGDFRGAPERRLVTELWYPAQRARRDAELDVASGPYPVVIHSHGFLGSRVGEAYLPRHLASRGYVVAAPDYPLSSGGAPGGATVADLANQPGDWSFVLDRVLDVLGEAADPERIGASGLSLGGLTTLLATYHRDLRDPRIGAALPIAAPACFFTSRFFATSPTPLLLLHGDSDLVVPLPENAARGYRHARKPKLLVALREGSHVGFSAFAPLFDPAQHLDVVSCAILSGGFGPGQGDDDGTIFAPPGGKREGLRIQARTCPAVCAAPIPDRPSMAATRQHELTRIAASAFFDTTLRGDAAAGCFLAHELEPQNPDVSVRASGFPARADLR